MTRKHRVILSEAKQSRPERSEGISVYTGIASSASSGPPRNDGRDFLLEIGCEELPADYMPGALDWQYPHSRGLATCAASVLSEKKVEWDRLECYGSPRRLVLLVRGIRPEVREVVEGPPVQVALDAKGEWTEAAKGFSRKQGVELSALKEKETARGLRLVIERTIPTATLLPSAVPEIIGRIAFPKTMRWDGSGTRFARPVRWTLALWGAGKKAVLVPCAYGGVKSGRVTYGTRRSGMKPVPVKDPSSYFDAMRRLGVRLERGQPLQRREGGTAAPLEFPKEKRAELQRQLEAAARRLSGQLPDQTTEEFEWLLNTVTFLAEDPQVMAGSFRPEYLDLPAEVLETAMAKHLKLFSVRSADGEKLLPKFLTVLEGKPGKPAMVPANYERILEARFTDARFFYREDARTPLEAKVSQLSKVVFHEKLGSVGDRIPRMERLMRAAVQQLEAPDSVRRYASEAARLAKADLVTQMVREFPSLQGVMGGQYARAEGRPGELAQAIADHYRPRTAGDPAPPTLLGALLSLVDRLDTLVGYFGAGFKPTGSLDPYALRRQAQGLVRILLSPPAGFSFVGLSIDRLSDESIQSWGPRLTLDPRTLKRELRGFLRERFEWLVNRPTAEGDRDLVAAVLAVDDDDLAGAWERLEILREYWSGSRDGKRQVLEWAAKVAERTSRIVKSVRGMDLSAAVDATALKEPAEKELWAAWSKVGPQIREQLKGRRFQEATQTYSTLYPTVHTFFEKVFVMDENIELRRNRLTLMREIHQSLSGSFADLSRLPLTQPSPPHPTLSPLGGEEKGEGGKGEGGGSHA